MVEKFKKHKFNILVYLFCAITMALFVIITFSCKTYAFTIDNNGNLVGDNLLPNSTNVSGSNVNIFFDVNIIEGKTYTFDIFDGNNSGAYALWLDMNGTNVQAITDSTSVNNSKTFTAIANANKLGFYPNNINNANLILVEGDSVEVWEPYGVWYSETNYDTAENLYENTLSQYNDIILANNYGYWKYIDYVEFEESNNYIFVPNTEEQNEWKISDLTNYNILKIGGYFDTFPLTNEPYQSNYNEVDTHINFKGYTPSDSFIVSFNNATGCNIEIYDNNYNVFTYTITENSEGVVDINLIRKYVANFDIYVIEMIIRPNNAEQNGVYFANNDYITAYNKGYNAATSNGDRKYIPQITELNNKIENLENQVQQKYNEGYTDGYNIGANGNNSLYNMVIAVADTPISIFKQIFNFNILGLDISGFIFGIISLLIIIWLIKKII